MPDTRPTLVLPLATGRDPVTDYRCEDYGGRLVVDSAQLVSNPRLVCVYCAPVGVEG